MAISANNCGRALAALLLFASGATAVADTLTWGGGASGSFSTGPWTSDGSHTAPENGDTLVFGTAGSFANDISELTVAGLSITAAGNVEIGGSQITLAGGGSLSKSGSGTYTNSVPLVLGTGSGQTVYVETASSCTIEMLSAISGDANLVYGNTSTSTGRVNLRNNGSDYTGATTARRGSVYVYSNDAFGSADGGTTLSGAANNALKVYFQGVTMGENFTVVANASNSPNNSPNYPVNFPTSNTFNGTWSVSGNGYFYNSGGTTTFNGRVAFSTIHFLGGGSLVFNGEGSTFANDEIYGNTITYNAKCKTSGTLTVGRTAGVNWINKAQRRNFNCENAMLYDETAPAALAFSRVSCTADMCGYDQTFSVISCGSGYSSSVVTSADPSTIHLTLPGSAAATCYAKFTGKVSLSFEGSRPISLGNTANTSTGSRSLTNAAAVTLLDGFKWSGSSVTVADGSTLTVGGVSLPTETVVAIRDRSDSVRSIVSLNAGVDLSVSGLSINGANMALGKTYGATGSGADVIDDDHFAGTGILRVLAGTPLTLTWAGGATGNFSTGPWSGGSGGHVTPIYGDTLVFPVGGVFANDIADLTVAGISVTANDAVTLTGSQIAVANGGAISKSGSGVYTNNVPLSLGTTATPAVNIDVAASCSLVMKAVISGPADIVYNNASASTGTINLRNDGSDYTGATTARRGVVNVYSSDAFGSTDGATTLSGAAENALKVYFRGVTMDENFTVVANASDTPNNSPHYPVNFPTSNTFNGTWSVSGSGYFYNQGGTTTFNGPVTFSTTHFLGGGSLVFNGEGSTFANDKFYGNTITYNAKCKTTGAMTIGGADSVNWINSYVGRRNFNCENAMLYDETAPAAISFVRAGCTADMRGFTQTFSYVSCASTYASSVVTSADPSTVHLTLPGTGNVNCYAKFTGQVSLSCEGSRPISLGNTANTSTGSLSLTNAANVTLLDGFKWNGSSVTVADGSTLTVGNATFPETLSVAIDDRAASGGNAAVSSKIALNADVVAETLTINGRTRSGGLTYGATGSGANVIDNAHFAGTGVLRVLKPCGTFIFLR
ncbi:MAG: hypothetical protein IJK04_14045 [Kiritimatiellae bacterium]|nr:hypothetical protein [Kiritimatiellia bacterium]